MSESERMPGIAEQVPRAADRVARLEDRVVRRGASLEVVGGADARQPGADDQDVDVLMLGRGISDPMAGRRRVGAMAVVRVAAIQATPVILDAEACVEKAVRLLGEAAAQGARLAVLPEAFVALYPSNAWAAEAARFSGFDELWERCTRAPSTCPARSSTRSSRGARATTSTASSASTSATAARCTTRCSRSARAVCCTATASSCRPSRSACSTASARATTSTRWRRRSAAWAG